MGYVSCTYVLNRASEERETRLRDLESQRKEYTKRDEFFIILLHLLLTLLFSAFSTSAVGIIRQIRQYVRRYLRIQKRAIHH